MEIRQSATIVHSGESIDQKLESAITRKITLKLVSLPRESFQKLKKRDFVYTNLGDTISELETFLWNFG